MLKPTRSHEEFKNFLKKQLQIHYLKHGFSKAILLQQKVLSTVWFADLSKVSEIVHYRYSLNRGTPARCPVDMFRSLLLMEILHERSIDNWVKTMRTTPIFAILSGFTLGDIPGVGTFYDFISRLWLASS